MAACICWIAPARCRRWSPSDAASAAWRCMRRTAWWSAAATSPCVRLERRQYASAAFPGRHSRRHRLQRPHHRQGRARLCRLARLPGLRRRGAEARPPSCDRSRRHDAHAVGWRHADQRPRLLCPMASASIIPTPARALVRVYDVKDDGSVGPVAQVRDARRRRRARWPEGGERRVGLGRRRPWRPGDRVQRGWHAPAGRGGALADGHQPVLRRR